jgi:hypothetical protein
MATLLAVIIGLVVMADPASAVRPNTVSNATFEWTVSDETNAAAFNGQCNFWSGGESDGTAATYGATGGNATVLKLNASDVHVPVSDYNTRCLDKTGQPVNFLSGASARRAGQKVRFTGGTGTLNPATGVSTIQWTGTFSINFYGTLVPFYIKDPKLTMSAGGTGTITATMGGYASDINEPDVRVPLTPQSNVVIATLSGVSSANTTGFTTTPVYSGVEYDVDPESGQAPQNRVNPGWGSWPTSFVDFQMQTGLGSYWYSSGGSIDVRKPPQALTVSYGTVAAPPALTTSVSPSANLNPKVAQALAVTGTNFTGFEASEAGVYVGLIEASKWQPGQVPNQADFVGTQFVSKAAIINSGFSTTVTVPANTVTDTGASYGIATFCAHGCANTNRGFDTFTPVTFANEVMTDPALARAGYGFQWDAPAHELQVGPYTWSIGTTATTTSLPAGLSLDPATGRVSGTPTTESVTKVQIVVTDSKTLKPRIYKKVYIFKVAPEAMTIVPSTLPNGSQGIPYGEVQLAVAGGTAEYKFKRTAGVWPKGMSMNGFGLVKGKPMVAGSFPISIEVRDGLKFRSTYEYVLVIDPPAPMVVSPEALPGATRNVAYSQQLSTAGGVGPFKYVRTAGTLPTGMTMTATGLVKGTPKVTGTFPITVTVTDYLKHTTTKDYVIEVS